MKTIIKQKSTVKSFYENIIKNNLPNEENLSSEAASDFKELLDNTSVEKNSRALDLGYGYGNYSILLAEKGYRVLSVDYISPSYFKDRIRNTNIAKKTKVLHQDLNFFIPKGKIDILVAKDVLHFLPSSKALFLISESIKLTNINGFHYLVIFTDIERQSDNGDQIVIENEANFTSDHFINLINKLYKGWKIKIKVEDYKEKSRSNTKGKFYFKAKRITIVARKIYDRRS